MWATVLWATVRWPKSYDRVKPQDCVFDVMLLQGNVAEVQYLRPWLMKSKYVTVFRSVSSALLVARVLCNNPSFYNIEFISGKRSSM